MDKKKETLITILLDSEASIADRDDAAMDLYEYDCDLVLNALVKVAKNSNDDPMVLNSCGESIASIWVKRNIFDKKCYEQLSKAAQDGIYYVIKYDRPQWLANLGP